MELIMVGAGIFVTVVLVLELGFVGYRRLKVHEQREIHKRLKKLQKPKMSASADILKHTVLSDIPWLNSVLKRIPGLARWKRLIDRADSDRSLGYFVLLSLFMMAVSCILTLYFLHNAMLTIVIVPLVGTLPILHLQVKVRQRVQKFQEQLPDALDLLGRALKAGHAFNSGMKLAADEFPAPLGKEFQKTVDEINFGLSVAQALNNLAYRVNCSEAKFFVVSVLLQRETGGNLTEILENLSYVLRERFKLLGKIRVLSAEGRLSGWVLLVMPLLLLLWLRISTPDYIAILFTEPSGQMALSTAAILMVVGLLVIKKMVTIRV